METGKGDCASKVPAHYISGFVDGEGCFSLNFRKDVRHEIKGNPQYFMWKASFAIVLRTDDIEVLKAIRNTLGCGKVDVTSDQARFHVEDLGKLTNTIIPFFDKYPLRAKKKSDFLLWKEAVEILYLHRQMGIGRKKGSVKWAPEDLRRLLQIYEQMRTFKSRRSRSKHVSVAQDRRWTDAIADGAPKRVRGLDLHGNSPAS
ncbi:MAG: LAGLIDADG family homing endonuclease [Chloroflexota bacterium]